MSVFYCAIPHFSAALARRDDPALNERPLILVGPEGRVFAASAEAAACGVAVGMTARAAGVRCPDGSLVDLDVPRCRAEAETLLQVLERVGPKVEPHGWGAAYVDLGDLARDRAGAVALCGEIGRAVRRELGEALQPALGWDSTKFTAQAAARHTRPGRLRVVAAAEERDFLRPLPVALLPLAEDALRQLCFLGLRTLGQYAALPPAAVWRQFGPAGKLAHRCARGEDDRPVVSRWQSQPLSATLPLEAPLADRGSLLAALVHLVSPLLAGLRAELRACGQVRLTVQFDDGSRQERQRTFLLPVADDDRVMRALEGLLDGLRWQSPATALAVALDQIQDAIFEQLTLFGAHDEREGRLRDVQRYLAARFGADCLRRAVLAQPAAPLPEWRVAWQGAEGAGPERAAA